MLTMIWAEDLKHGIGKDGKIPWRIPDDVKFFKEQTIGNTVIMGRKTFDSIGKPLPRRQNIVLTHHKNDLPETVVAYDDFGAVTDLINNNQEQHFIIIGGQAIYQKFIEQSDQLLVTKVNQDFKCDTFAPAIPDSFKKSKSVTVLSEGSVPEHTFETWVK
ncbi:dihydrofolate reductase [Pediococcus argentinicus]|uniref:dihydrofolate reductase n=1 Tax=Pediococcus argentinicus TaxID=480391 RepID=UPI00338EA153